MPNYIIIYPYNESRLTDRHRKNQKRFGKLMASFEINIHQLCIQFIDEAL